MAQGRRLFAPHCPIEAKTMDQDQRRGRCRIRTEQLAGGAIGRLGDRHRLSLFTAGLVLGGAWG